VAEHASWPGCHGFHVFQHVLCRSDTLAGMDSRCSSEAVSVNDERITRIQWAPNGDISVYSSSGFVGRLAGSRAAAFTTVITEAFAAAARALAPVEAEPAEGP
jgi:hypothetical protein